MATRRVAAAYIPCRFSSSGKILGNEAKAAENVYIKEHNPQGKPPTASDVNANASTSATSEDSVNSYQYRAIVTAVVTSMGYLGWNVAKGHRKGGRIVDYRSKASAFRDKYGFW